MNILVTGASRGIGLELSKSLINDGHKVFGVGRRSIKEKKIKYLKIDLASENSWEKIIKALKRNKFKPDVVIFNAALLQGKLEEVHKINFLSVIKGVDEIMKNYQSCHFIAISSTAALRGAGAEFLEYNSSKAALSIAFESLYQKYKSTKYQFSLVYFGPVRGGMNPFKESAPFQLSLDLAVEAIKEAIKKRGPAYYHPWWIFYILKLIRVLPGNLDFLVFSLMEKFYNSNRL